MITCPKCQSSEVTFQSKKQTYICDNCDFEFTPVQEFQPLRIFISYGHDKHAAFAQRLDDDLNADDLKKRGYETWYDLERLKPGGDWERYIEEGLLWASEKKGIGRFILIMTPHSVRRPDGYCLNEISRALDLHLPVILIMLGWSSPPLSISRIQWLDMQFCSKMPIPEVRYKNALTRLIDALENQNLAFEGQASLLRANLNPLSFEADVNHYQKWFRGRKWVFNKINKWLDEPNAPRLFWITVLPGDW